MQSLIDLRINSQRFEDDFNTLAEFGATPDGGVDRPALSASHLAACDWLRTRALDAGLEFQRDAAGNHSIRLACGPPGAPALLLGSHLDSVPNGGRFDGALGVLAALEVLRVAQENDVRLPVNLEAVEFTDEEGTLFGLLGSSALAGKLRPDDLVRPRGGREVLLDGLARAGLEEAGLLKAARRSGELAGYLELHIEQGPRLLRTQAQIGVVTAIVGIASYHLVFIGRADHAGTTPMLERLDAAQGACAFTRGLREMVIERFPECVANVGQLTLEPGAFNIVPQRARLALELRSALSAELSQLRDSALELARQKAEHFGLDLEIEPAGAHQPAPLSPVAQQVIREAAANLGLTVLDMASGAGHDAQSLADSCPTGMIFVPSQAGASHSSRELTLWQDCLNGANLLLQAAMRLAFAVTGKSNSR
jgi:N-carbamoyl-L-amino-acid hydrolase